MLLPNINDDGDTSFKFTENCKRQFIVTTEHRTLVAAFQCLSLLAPCINSPHRLDKEFNLQRQQLRVRSSLKLTTIIKSENWETN